MLTKCENISIPCVRHRSVILAFSGDEFLVVRQARKVLKAKGYSASNTSVLEEEITGSKVKDLISQGALFGQQALYIDFDTGFVGQAHVKNRNGVMKALQLVPEEMLVVVVDSKATVGRKKVFSRLGEHEHLPTPRFDNLDRWVYQELVDRDVPFEPRVPGVLAELFGQDLGSILGEIEKMVALGENITEKRVYSLANRSSPQNVFGLIEAGVAGKSYKALMICEGLVDQGEEPVRVLGALNWQFKLVVQCLGLLSPKKEVTPQEIARNLKVQVFAAKKALSIARRLDEDRLLRVLEALLDGETAIKTGRDARASLGDMGVRMASVFSRS